MKLKGKFSFMKKNQVVVAVIGLMLIAAGYLNFTNENQSLEVGKLSDSVDMAEIGDAKLVSGQPANDSNLLEENTVNTNEEENQVGLENQVEENKNEVATQIEQNNKEVSDNNKEVSTEVKEDNNKEVTAEVKENDNREVNNPENTVTQTNTEVSIDEYFTKSRLDRDTMYSQMIESYQKILEKTTISESQRGIAQKEITKINEQKNAIMITENLMKTKGFEDLIIFINDSSINVIVKGKKLKPEQIAQIQNIITRELKAKIENIHISTKV